MKQIIQNILIFKKGALGDIIATTCGIMLLKKHYAGCKITLLSTDYSLNICPPGTIVDEFMDYYRLIEKKNGFIRLVSELRKRKFDLAINFRDKSEKDDLLIMLCGAKITIGSNDTFFSNFLTHKIPKHTTRTHEYVKQINRLKPLGVDTTFVSPYIHITQNQQDAADRFFKANGLILHKTLLIAPTASNLSKTWFAERFVAIGKRFIDKYGYHVIVTLDPNQEEICKKIAVDMGEMAVLTPLLDIGTLAAVISNSALCLCNNSGSMNISVAVHTPTLALSTTPSADWGAFGANNITIYPFENEKDEKLHDWTQKATVEERLEIQNKITIDLVWDKLNYMWDKLSQQNVKN